VNPPGILPPRSISDTAGKVRVLIVDDSVVIRHLLREALSSDPQIEVVGAESNGLAALASIPVVKPDLVTLDIEMPQMDGLETLRRIRKDHPRLRTIMFSTLTTRGAASTFEALSLGADDYVTKAANGGNLDQSLVTLRSELLPKIRQFFSLTPQRTPQSEPPKVPGKSPVPVKPLVVGIGVSTGGPDALARLIPRLPSRFPLPILIVQHMPEMFTRLLAERLDSLSPLHVVEAEERMELSAGQVIIARGGRHLVARRSGGAAIAMFDDGPPENSCRPSVDVLFRSLAEAYPGAVAAVMLTGMGSDGLKGTRALKAAGAFSIVQSQESSVVWGMPGAVAEAGLADRIVPLEEIAAELTRLAER
jgi:two-component system chemotaxis response regulator CheB